MAVVPLNVREELLMKELAAVRDVKSQSSPLAVFIKKFQESLTRMETFEVSMASSGSDGKQRIQFKFL
jgi:E3 ubiquitin-protein ligase TRIP12